MARILQIAHYYGPIGGIERVVEQYCRALAEEHEVSALVSATDSRTTRTVEDGISVTRVGRIAHWRRMSICPAFPFWLRRMKPDIAHVHIPNPMAELSCLLAGLRCPILVTYHMDLTKQKYLNRLYSHLQRQFLKRATAIVVSSENLKKTSPSLSEFQEKTRVIPFGLPLHAHGEASGATADNPLFQSLEQGRIVLFVGRLIHYKGLEVLLRAMTRIDARCVIVGEGYLREKLANQAQSLGIESKLIMPGRISDVDLAALYQKADVFVLPSNNRTEAFGLCQVEAMSFGVPLVCCEIGTGTSFVNQDGVTGFVVEPDSPDALADAINRILEDSALRGQFSLAAKKRAAEEFSEDLMFQRIRSLYREILTG